MNTNTKISRLVAAKQKGNLDKVVVVQLKYCLNNKYRILDKMNEIEINSVSGTINYKIMKIEYDEERVTFLYGLTPYILEINHDRSC